MGVITLNGIFEINLGLPEIRYCYNFVSTTKERSKFYFKHRSTKCQLVQMLLDSGMGVNDAYIIVEGNWEFSHGADRVRPIPKVTG